MKTQSTAHELLQLMIHKAAYIGRTGEMVISIPYRELMDHPSQEYEDVTLEVKISTNWIHEGETNESGNTIKPDSDTEGN